MSSLDRPIIKLNDSLLYSSGVYSLNEPMATDHFGNELDTFPELDIRMEQEKVQQSSAYNYLRTIDLSCVETVLELSADYGSTTAFLQQAHFQKAKQKSILLDVIKTDFLQVRASVNMADAANVCAICRDLRDLDIPTAYYDFILVDHIELLGKDEITRSSNLKKLSEALSANGVLSIRYENPHSPRRWLDAKWQPNTQQIQGAVAYSALYSQSTQAASLESSLLAKLETLGLGTLSGQCLLPTMSDVRTIISHEYLQDQSYAINHFYGVELFGEATVSAYLLLDKLKQQSNLASACSGQWLLAAKSKSALEAVYQNDFSHFSGTSRQAHWRTITEKRRGVAAVTKRRMIADAALVDDNALGLSISQDLSDQAFLSGELLAGDWLKSLLVKDHGKRFCQLVASYNQWLSLAIKQHASASYDMLPFNIIVDDKGTYQQFDQEWTLSETLSQEFVLFRAVFWFVVQNRRLFSGFASAHTLHTVGDVVQYVFDDLRISADLAGFCRKETSIQTQISGANALGSAIDSFDLLIDSSSTTLGMNSAKTNSTAQKPQLQSHIYWGAKAGDGYAIKPSNRVITEFPVSDTVIACRVNIAGLDVAGKILRIDPVKQGGFFKLTTISLFDNNGQVLWAIDSQQSIAAVAHMVNVAFCHSPMGGVFVAENDDAQLFFDLNDIANITTSHTLAMELQWSGGPEYNAVMAQMGNKLLQQRSIIHAYKQDQNRVHQLQAHTNHLESKIAQQKAQIQELLSVVHGSKLSRVKRAIGRRLNRSADFKDSQNPATMHRVSAEHVAHVGQSNEDYQVWIESNSVGDQDIFLMQEEIKRMVLKPVFSIIVPVYNIEEKWLRKAVDSVINQSYPHWQLCLVDDASPKEHIRPLLKQLATEDERITIRLNTDNGGIAKASQDGIKIATGDYIALLDHDDELALNALFENAKLINEDASYGLIYSDEDKMEMSGRRVDPFFKPDFSPELLESQNYICHFTVMRKDIVDAVGGFRPGYDGSQDHDIILRVTNAAERVGHIPKILYHWRKVPGSTADVYDSKSYAWEAGRKAVEAAVVAKGDAVEVVLGPLQGSYRARRVIVGEPGVDIIIPFKDRPDLLQTCIESIMSKSTYQNFKILGVSNNSEEPATQQMMAELATKYASVTFIEKNEPFNFSMLCNFGVEKTNGDYVLLLNNDIEISSADWLETLLSHAQREEIGAVGGKLLYPDGRIQHAGIVTGMFGVAGHPHAYFGGHDDGYYARLRITSNVSAVTGAMLMVSRKKYHQVGGLNVEDFAVAYNDVDFCLRLLEQGYRNVFTPFVEAIHYESASRGYEDNPEKAARLAAEQSNFKARWADFLTKGDPYFNPNFDLEKADFSIKL